MLSPLSTTTLSNSRNALLEPQLTDLLIGIPFASFPPSLEVDSPMPHSPLRTTPKHEFEMARHLDIFDLPKEAREKVYRYLLLADKKFELLHLFLWSLKKVWDILGIHLEMIANTSAALSASPPEHRYLNCRATCKSPNLPGVCEYFVQ